MQEVLTDATLLKRGSSYSSSMRQNYWVPLHHPTIEKIQGFVLLSGEGVTRNSLSPKSSQDPLYRIGINFAYSSSLIKLDPKSGTRPTGTLDFASTRTRSLQMASSPGFGRC